MRKYITSALFLLLIFLTVSNCTRSNQTNLSKDMSYIPVDSILKLDTLTIRALQVGNIEEALIHGKKLLAISKEQEYDKGIASGYRGLGFCRLLASDYKEALEYFEKAYEIDPDRPETYRALARNAELKRDLMTEGVQFSSETDTEVVTHLVSRELETSESLMQLGLESTT